MDRLIGLWALVFVRPMFVVGILVASIGLALIAFSGGYFALSAYGASSLDELTVTQDESGLTQEDLTRDLSAEDVAPKRAFTSSDVAPFIWPAVTPEAAKPLIMDEVREDDTPEASDAADVSAYDDYGILQDFSHYRAEAGVETLSLPLKTGFRLTTPEDLVQTHGKEPRPTRILIPAINLDSHVVDLDIIFDGEEAEWQTADHAVGFHIRSATPGEIGNTVMSGHVNSPFRGEGSIFRRLDEVAPMLRRGEIVDIIVVAESNVFLYRGTDTTVVLPEDVDVFEPVDKPTLSLVTCAPATTYSHRFIVNAVLVGIAQL